MSADGRCVAATTMIPAARPRATRSRTSPTNSFCCLDSPTVGPRECLTRRARACAVAEVGDRDGVVSRTAAKLGVGWHTVMRHVISDGTPKVQDPARLDAGWPRSGWTRPA